MTSFASSKLLLGSQVFSSFPYPSHFTRYWIPHPLFLDANISSILYSGYPAWFMGPGGSGTDCDGYCGGCWGSSKTSLNTEWTRFHDLGSCNRYDPCPIFSKILKGPNFFWLSFLLGRYV